MYINTYTMYIDGRVVTKREWDPMAENIVVLSHNGDLIKRLGSEFLSSNICIYIYTYIIKSAVDLSAAGGMHPKSSCVRLYSPKIASATVILHNIYLASNIAAVAVTIC